MLKNRDGGEQADAPFCYILACMNDTTTQDPRRELQSMLASRLALIVVESREEARVLGLVREVSLKVKEGRGWGVFQWTVTEGLQRIDIDLGGPQRMLADPEQLLKHLKATPMPGIYVLLDFHPYLKEPVNVRLLKDIAQGYDQVARTVVLMSYEVTLPDELEQFAARLHLALPTSNERLMIITRVVREWNAANPGKPCGLDREVLDQTRRQSQWSHGIGCGAPGAPRDFRSWRAHPRGPLGGARREIRASESRRLADV